MGVSRGDALLLPLLLAACAPEAPTTGGQPPVLAWLVLHVDPLPRRGDETCVDEALTRCGALDAGAWRERTENLAWLSERWISAERTMNLELGPEASLGWAEEPSTSAALEASLSEEGEEDAAAAVAASAESGRASVAALVGAGAASLGVHVHGVLPQDGSSWGEVDLSWAAPTEGGSPEACVAWAQDPLIEPSAPLAEAVLAYGAAGAAAVADPLGAPLLSFTGHLPRSMSGKITVVEDPDALDPSQERAFPASFAPRTLGSAYSECLTYAVDHPPFEAWPADEERALLAGDGPAVIPGNRVVGSMSEHLGVASDSSLGANARRLLQALVNWRYEGLLGRPARPWVFTFHEHLFDLYPGEPNGRIAEERDLRPTTGQKYRQDLEAMASMVDALAARSGWQGVQSDAGGVMRWALPEERSAEGSAFSYGSPEEAPPEGLDPQSYPYLPLVAERLARTHLVCAGSAEGVEIYGMLRCEAGWAWAGEGSGYHCADLASPGWVYLLVPEGPTCLEAPSAAAAAAAVDDEALGAPTRCEEGIEVPIQGLLLEPAEGPWWADRCLPWG